MEVVLADGNTMWLDEYTTLSLDAVAFSRDAESERTVIFLADGSLIVEVSEHGLTPKPTRIDSRAATVYLDEYGLYRLQALPSGGLRVEVLSGLAEAATTTGGVLVRAESAAEVGGGEVQRSEGQLTLSDDFAVWVDARRQIAAGESANYVDLRYSRQAAQLDNYGSWVYADSINAWAWQPTVGGSWQPYQAGRWYWTPTGYAWISYEPWGWLPYHYGSWNFDVGFGWVWSYGNYWGPAWVSWIRWPGYVGWCPYGYYNNWYWNSYPGHRPDYPGGGGGGAYQPPRRDVMPPPRTASHRVGPDASTSRLASDPAVDLSGRVRLAEVDRRGWTVVADDDFASPNLARLARSGDRVMPTAGDQTGVVMTGPLTTRSPSVASPRSEIERVFRGVEVRATADVSPLLARDNSLDPAVARQLAQPTTVGEIGQRSRDAAASNRQTVASGLALGAGSPFRAPSQSRAAAAESLPADHVRIVSADFNAVGLQQRESPADCAADILGTIVGVEAGGCAAFGIVGLQQALEFYRQQPIDNQIAERPLVELGGQQLGSNLSAAAIIDGEFPVFGRNIPFFGRHQPTFGTDLQFVLEQLFRHKETVGTDHQRTSGVEWIHEGAF